MSYRNRNYSKTASDSTADKAQASSPEKASSESMPANLFSKTLKYPLDLEKAQGHYMIFNILTRVDNQKANDAVDLNVISRDPLGEYNNTFTTERFFDAGIPTKMIKDTIVLYMPDDVSVNFKSNYSSENEIGRLVGGGAAVADWRKGNIGFEDMAKGIGVQAAKSVLGVMSFFTGGGLEGSYELIQRKTGLAAAPLKEMIFEGIDFRTFEYSFTMNPRNRKEAQEIKKILDTFTYHMLPEKVGTGAALLFRVPSEFTIRYMYRGFDNNYLNQITHCALSNMKVDYGGGEKYITYRQDDIGAPPVTTKVSLTFEELELIDKRRATQGTHRSRLRGSDAMGSS